MDSTQLAAGCADGRVIFGHVVDRYAICLSVIVLLLQQGHYVKLLTLIT